MTKAKAIVTPHHDPADLNIVQGGVLSHMALRLFHIEAFSRVQGIDVTDPGKYVAVLVDGSTLEVEADVTDPDSLAVLAEAVLAAPIQDVFVPSPEGRFDRLLREALDLNMHMRDGLVPA